ncbi:MAG TPA: ferritin family protein [Steroidobacteraceae bacterium]|nr:ferritin family protein [Steroidobacteraceae bacterium]
MRDRPRTPALKFMPAPVESPEALLSLARALEKEAVRRYLELASSMRLRNETRLAALFDFLASIEEKHAAHIVERAAQGSYEMSTSDLAQQEVPENFDAEAGESSLLTPYRALAIAVRNETRAFTFYSYLAATAPNESVQRLAEEMAKEELAHADLLRRERRKAYRAERFGAPGPLPQLPQNVTVLWSFCLETEARAARYHRALAEMLQSQEDAGSAAFTAAAEDEEDCARQAAKRIGRSFPDLTASGQPNIVGGRRLLEEAFERYSDIAGRSEEEEVMKQALSLAERASRRLFQTSLALANRAR